MPKKLFSLFLLMIIFLQVPFAYAQEITSVAPAAAVTDNEYLNNIFVDVIGCSPIVSYGEQLSVTIQLKNVPETRKGSAQWYLDGVPLAPYYYSQFEFSEGKIYKLLTPVTFKRESSDKAVVRLDMVIGDSLRNVEINVPLQVYSSEFYDAAEKKANAYATNRGYLDYINFDVIKCPEILSYGETLTIEFKMRDVVETRTGSAQWYLNGTPLRDYYYSSFECSNGKTHKFSYNFPFDKSTGNNALISLDIVIGDYLRRIDFNVPLQVYTDEFYDEIDNVLATVRPVNIEATLRRDTYTYHDVNLRNKKEFLPKGTKVYFKDSTKLKDSLSSALIKKADGSKAYIDMSALSISSKNYTVYQDYTIDIKEKFVNAKGYTSKTNYLIWINTERQKVNVFLGSGRGGDWRLLKTFPCATGKNLTPTPEGAYEYVALDNKWTFPNYYVAPILYFNMYRGLAFHSRPYSYNNTLFEATIGTPASHGCIRMYDEDVAWLKQYIPFSTAIQVF